MNALRNRCLLILLGTAAGVASHAQTNTFPSSGNVGIGTTVPASLLSVGDNSQFQVNGGGQVVAGAWSAGTVTVHVSNANTYAGLSLYGASNSYFMDVNNNGIWDPSGNTWNGLAIGTGTNYPMRFATNSLTRMTILESGNVGIGTTLPGEKLELNGNLKLAAGSEYHLIFSDGSVQSHAWDGVLESADYAESVDVTGDRSSFEPGDLLVIDSSRDGRFQKADTAYSTLISGVYSTKPGALGRRKPRSVPLDKEVPMAMVGIVPTKVSTENGPIHRGDLLVSSSNPGYAMKGTDRDRMMGAVLGKAMGTISTGKGVIEVLISLQ